MQQRLSAARRRPGARGPGGHGRRAPSATSCRTATAAAPQGSSGQVVRALPILPSFRRCQTRLTGEPGEAFATAFGLGTATDSREIAQKHVALTRILYRRKINSYASYHLDFSSWNCIPLLGRASCTASQPTRSALLFRLMGSLLPLAGSLSPRPRDRCAEAASLSALSSFFVGDCAVVPSV